jgi:hypothetical protein
VFDPSIPGPMHLYVRDQHVEAGHFVRSARQALLGVDVWHVSTGIRCMCTPISPQTRMGVADQMIQISPGFACLGPA